MSWNRQQQLSAGAQGVVDQPKRLLVFGDMLENIEHANQIKMLAKWRVSDVRLNQVRTRSSTRMLKPFQPQLEAHQTAIGKRDLQRS